MQIDDDLLAAIGLQCQYVAGSFTVDAHVGLFNRRFDAIEQCGCLLEKFSFCHNR